MGRQCGICHHDARQSIDEALVTGIPYREIAKQHDGISISALHRHNAGHVSPALAKLYQARVEKGSLSLLQRVEGLCEKVESVLAAAESDGKVHITLSAVREMRQNLELLGKITGELRDQPSTVINVLASDDWHRARGVILDVLAGHPEIRAEVAGRLAELEPAR